MTLQVPAGTNAFTLPGRNPCVYVSLVGSAALTGPGVSTITFAGGALLPGAFGSGYILEIAQGPGKGECAPILSNTANSITVAADVTGYFVPGSSLVCVRKLVTLSQILGLVAFEDQVIIKRPDGTQDIYMYDGADWINAVDGTPAGAVALDPCEPFCIVAAAARTVTMTLCQPDYSCCEERLEDCCIKFDGTQAGGWKSSGTFGLTVQQTGAAGAPANSYLAAQVVKGDFRVEGPAPCPGDWTHRLTDTPCLKLCWDVRLFSDGNDMAVIPTQASIQICSGTLCATFTVTTPITENGGPNGGWYRFCAPIKTVPAAGPLPASAIGTWSGVTPAQWNTLLTNVTTVAFVSDPLKPLPNSKWGWDNICLEEGDCDCLDFVETAWNCVPLPGGGYTWTLTGTVTNNSIYTADKIFVRPLSPPGMTLSPSQINVNLPPGASTTINITFNGVPADTEVCFRLVIFNRELGECCKEDFCVETPCVKLVPLAVECTPAAGVVASFVITNTTAAPITGIYLIGIAPAVISPAFYSLGTLAPGASTTITGVGISGLPAGGVAQFRAIIIGGGGLVCCEQKGSITVPPCPQVPGQLPVPVVTLPVAPRAEPCPPRNAVTLPPAPAHPCALICCERILCDPTRPGTWTYSFVIQNATTQPMTQLLFPSPQVSPSGVTFSPPLLPGQAATVTLTLTGVPPGPFTLPMIFFDEKTGECCRWQRQLLLVCECAQVVSERITCASTQGGLQCYNVTVTVQNLTGTVIDVIYFTPVTPASALFVPDSFNVPGLLPNATVTLNFQIKVPPTAGSLTYYMTLHDEDFEHCCATPDFIFKLPDCCACTRDFVFEGGNGPLPAGINIINLERDSAGKLGFGAVTTTWPYVCMACSGRGTIVRIDANTGVVLGEYRTAPQPVGINSSPSRTTVDRFGECWVGNRQDNGPGTGAVARIGLAIGGTRGTLVGLVFTPNPAGEYLQGPFTYLSPSVWDRNGDGYIRTSSGLANVLDWDSGLTNGNQLGMPTAGNYLAADELITNYVRVPGNTVRGMAIDANNDLWAGTYFGSSFQKVSGVTGSLIGPNITSLSSTYGALVDANNMLWSVDRLSTMSLYRYHVTTAAPPGTNAIIPDPGLYGIGIDPCSGNVWTSSVYTSDDLETDPGDVNNTYDPRAWLRRFSPAGNLTLERAQAWPLSSSTSAQGLCVDRLGKVWVSAALYSRIGLQKYDPIGDIWTSPGLPAVTVPFSSSPYPGSTGCAEDHLGRIWVSDNGDHAAHRFNPTSNTWGPTTDLGNLAAPYNYSDMTGAVALNAGGQTGLLTAIHDSTCPGTDWGRITWTTIGITPDCSIKAEVRASDNPVNFPNTWTPVTSGASFCGKGIKGRYIEVRLTFSRPGGANCIPTCNPRLCALRIECCDQTGGQPVITLPGEIVVAPGSLTQIPGAVAFPVARLGAVTAEGAWSVNDGAPVVFTLSGSDTTGDGIARIPVTFSASLPPGQHTVTLHVSSSAGEASGHTSVLIADQPPQISGLPGLSQVGFRVPLPDYRPLAAVSDDLTPRAALTLSQSPAPGTLVTQGAHPVIVTVRDTTGHSASAHTIFTVLPVLSIRGPSNYAIIPSGQPISVAANLAIPATQIASYLIEFVSNDRTITTPAAQLPATHPALPPGEYSLRLIAISHDGTSSASTRQAVLVLEPTISPIQPAFYNGVKTPNCFLRFIAPSGSRCCVQTSPDLINWTDLEVFIGAGTQVDVIIPSTTQAQKRAFFRVLVDHPE